MNADETALAEALTRERASARRSTIRLCVGAGVAIFILIALLFGGFNHAKTKQAIKAAKLQISLLENALMAYQADTGSVPAHGVPDGTGGTGKIYSALYPGAPGAGIYLPELDPAAAPQGWLGGATGPGPHKIFDPWGNEYRYRSNVSGSSTIYALNPDFDLWSAGPDGMTTAGPGGAYDPTDPANLDDIRNW